MIKKLRELADRLEGKAVPHARVKSAWILYRLAGHAEEGAALFAALAADPSMGGTREHATEALTHIGGISGAFPDRRTQ
ncbi:hypothetical protein [Streptomyces sp. NPDC050564]|uniref:hypothetical protein n=1 Tax=Streptomyces sp. NPDC050564 TaxID=3365631 RepID=UPI0037B01FD2